MRGYPVYRLNKADNTLVRVGSVIEHRRSRRSMNRIGLMKLAQRIFASSPGDIICIGPDSIIERYAAAEEQALIQTAG